MLKIRRSAERGHFEHGWLDTRHTFSFADYYDPEFMSFRSLRVMNEDVVSPGQGFGMHGHRDMEILTIVLDGQLEHKDSLGNGEVLQPGEFQRMTAGTGIRHSEFNPSADRPVHLYQIWLMPEKHGLAPGYQQKRFDPKRRRADWLRVASQRGIDGALTIQQDAEVFLSDLGPGATRSYSLTSGRHGWLQLLRGEVAINGAKMATGDGVAISNEPELIISTDEGAEVMLFDLS